MPTLFSPKLSELWRTFTGLRQVGASKSELGRLKRTSFGGRVICEDRRLLIEEAPKAYKDAQLAVEQLSGFGLAVPVATFQPLVTFKKCLGDEEASERTVKRKKHTARRRDR